MGGPEIRRYSITLALIIWRSKSLVTSLIYNNLFTALYRYRSIQLCGNRTIVDQQTLGLRSQTRTKKRPAGLQLQRLQLSGSQSQAQRYAVGIHHAVCRRRTVQTSRMRICKYQCRTSAKIDKVKNMNVGIHSHHLSGKECRKHIQACHNCRAPLLWSENSLSSTASGAKTGKTKCIPSLESCGGLSL